MKDYHNGSVSTAASINAKLAEAASKEFFWGCELSKEKPTVQWNFEEEEDDQDFLQHTLFLRHAVLGKSVSKDEKQIVEIQTQNFAGDEVKQPILSLTSGKTDMCQLDLNFGHEVPVTFRLVEGAGPVFLSAQQLVEFPQEIEEDDFLTATDTETELDEEVEEEEEDEEEDEVDAKGKKRKANGVTTGSKKKRGKLDSEGLSNGTESDEVDEEDEEDEDGEDEEEEMETSEEEEVEEEDDDDDYEESPKKKSAKGKKGRQSAGSAKAAKKPKPKAKAKKPAGKKGKAK